MNQEVLKQPVMVSDTTDDPSIGMSTLWSYGPAAFAILGSLALVALRINLGGERFISDGALMMLALASYLIAAVFHLTNLYAPFRFAEKLGMWAATLGVFFNLSSWLVRWVAAYDRELAIFNAQGQGAADMPWLFRYVPFANLYDLSLAFAFGAGITTLIVMRRNQFRIVAALSLPLAAIILVLARFIGSEILDLPPVLDSYWRPIHVGIASISYGIALVCFAVAVLYLLKDGLKVEKMAVWTSLFALSVFITISKFSIFSLSTFGVYTASTFIGTSRMSLGLRADIPYVGWLIVAASALLLGAIVANIISFTKNDANARKWGTRFLWSAFVVQAAGIGMLVYQIKSLQNIVSYISTSQYAKFGAWMLQQEDMPQAQINAMAPQQLYDIANKWIMENGSQLHLSLNANPVELAALITAFTGTFFIVLFGINTEKIRTMLPSADTLDGLMYKLAGVAFAGLALLLMTGAVWANESWGRYWGWDAKEVGALVAWLTYAGFLHSRIAYGWRGRKSAYFAIVAFLFVIFTYLGVSYLLPGLHSYA
ncbi:MAG: cytochrome c biogenesis protein CcsA [Pyrinomonadaceae bacterium]|nr:cytochrome c biogenesis protein CcsA [Acidobacteriota bacterium]MBK7932461.1 cytochrome c biogenesis protein CcsA [Acidobacteriota bacterium]MBP7375603.1 cytochrome c biogenesis protein CcsA [Pyrinomonadaceae bacterium]